jgi:hypothetical protein
LPKPLAGKIMPRVSFAEWMQARSSLPPRDNLMLDRRDVLRVGALSLFGGAAGSMPSFAGQNDQSENRSTRRGAAKSCIFLLLQGGPSHIDLWDPKPDAPAEVRGTYKPIDTSVSGIRVGELMTSCAKAAGDLTFVRSMTHRFTNHIAGTYITLTGSTDQPDQDREADAKDFPGVGAVLNYLEPPKAGLPTSISLPTWLSIPGPSNRMPGQYGGFLGALHDPLLIAGEPQKPDFRPASMSLPDSMSPERVSSRYDLLKNLDAMRRDMDSPTVRGRGLFSRTAYELLTDPRVREALDLTRESDKTRDRYGRTKMGQSLLLARRLVEIGVRFVGYNEFNQAWDHHNNIGKTLHSIASPMDQAFAALVSDLGERGMLDTTLVVNTGEFGRTPTINNGGGRDHWPDVYTTVLAGGGIRGGMVYGASDSKGGQVKDNPVSPADFLATLWHLLGVDPGTELRDRQQRPVRLSLGKVVEAILA